MAGCFNMRDVSSPTENDSSATLFWEGACVRGVSKGHLTSFPPKSLMVIESFEREGEREIYIQWVIWVGCRS
jgi:hypothetical protein